MSNQYSLKKKKSLLGLGHRRTFLEKKSLELVKKDVARFRLSVRGFCYLFGLLTRNNDASAMPRHTLLRTAAHIRRAAPRRCRYSCWAAYVCSVFGKPVSKANGFWVCSSGLIFGRRRRRKRTKKNQKSHHYYNHIHILHIPHYSYTYCFWMSAAGSEQALYAW